MNSKKTKYIKSADPFIEGLEKNQNQNKVEQTLNDFFNWSNCLHAICAFEEDLKQIGKVQFELLQWQGKTEQSLFSKK